jgi:uncharacterized protein YjiK
VGISAPDFIHNLIVEPSVSATLSDVKGEPYEFDLSNPKQVIILGEKLNEISGLVYSKPSHQLMAVNDEVGVIFGLSQMDGKIIEQIEFGKKGDYEGIALAGDKICVVESKGHIHIVTKSRQGYSSEVINTPLKSENDVEGLTYKSDDNLLILACKGQPSIEANTKHKSVKAFYGYDLECQKLNEEPLFLIEDASLIQHFSRDERFDALPKYKRKDFENRLLKFSPSALAWHMESKQFFILSSVGKLLVITDAKGNIRKIEFLNEKLHSQPEGICFSDAETMYISNEGRNLLAKILVYQTR